MSSLVTTIPVLRLVPKSWNGTSAAGALGGLLVPAPAAVRRSPGAPASRSAPAAACSTRLRALRAERGAPRVAPQLPDREGRRRAGFQPLREGARKAQDDRADGDDADNRDDHREGFVHRIDSYLVPGCDPR